MCDPDLKILNINARWGGATHDAFIWRNSNIKAHLQENFNHNDDQSWLIGDSGYPQEPYLMTPILNPLPGSPEDRYMTTHILARNCIERCNGVLKTRFRYIKMTFIGLPNSQFNISVIECYKNFFFRCIMGERKLRYTPPKCGNIIIACAVLHNIAIATNENFVINFKKK